MTITGSLYKIFSPVPAVGYWAQNKLFRDALAAGKTSQGTAKTPEAMAAVVRNTTVQGTLSIIFVTLAIIVIAAAIVSTIRTLRGAATPDTEDPRHESRFFAPAGFLPTPAEKQLQSEWATAVPDQPKRRAHH